MKRYRCVMSYEGTNYCGWQVQPNGTSIQGEIERALAVILKHPCRVMGAGRTDAGVHAIGQVAHFETEVAFEIRRLLHSLNGLLPQDIRILSLESVESTFHAQYSAQRKIYRYRIWQDPIVDPFLRRIVCHDKRSFCEMRLQQVLKYFEGTHDFAAFVNQGTPVNSTIRTIYRAELIKEKGGFSLEFEGNGFLYKMVRNLVGTLLDIGCGKQDPSLLPILFDSKDRRLASAAAPACGLCLKQVLY
ncbi:MAG: tRNA pseudouridine(38-40) synthase TruA [Verrucomicrobia bacterium]|nr:tRNA pseudouridine(38-40) synthase TruA [Verrucomicrobiota bacterium]MBS0646528.1 tRNA pseudouridine(38-40) synthase TruA [Verrucomicrobiota bacterium]